MAESLFSLESLLEAAAESAGTDDLDLDPFGPTLELLLRALGEEAGLYPARVWRTLDNLVEELTLRAARRRLLSVHPEVGTAPIVRPVFITGLPRTGTTLLHNLMGRAPGFRAWKLWEMRAPITMDDRSPDDLRADSQMQIDALYNRVPGFRKIHPLNADWPDECSWLLRHSFSSLVWSFQYYIPSYRAAQCATPQHAAYADFRSWLSILRHQHPAGRLILKDPCHLWNLDALLDTFPDATVIHLHRDPAEAGPSLASLCHALHAMDSSQTHLKKTGAEVMALLEAGERSVRTARATRPADRFIDLPYTELVADPLGVVRRLMAELGETQPGEARASLDAAQAWMVESRHGASGRHTYSPEMFGLRADELRERFSGL